LWFQRVTYKSEVDGEAKMPKSVLPEISAADIPDLLKAEPSVQSSRKLGKRCNI
jgi:hypothetical protein